MRWLIYGIIAAILFGFWGLFDKLSSSINPFTSNLLLYISAVIVIIITLMFTRKLKFSKYSVLAGIFSGIGDLTLFYALLTNKLVLAMPFVSFSGATFFILLYLTEKPKYTRKQKIIAFSGLILTIIGMILISTGQIGVFNFFKQFTLDATLLIPGLIILVCFTFWTYFMYKSVSKEKINAVSYSFWLNLTALTVAILAILFFNISSLSDLTHFSKDYIFPILSGICIAIGTMLIYSSFKTTTTKTKIQEAIVGILANGELIPLLFLSYFVLGEWVPEGFIGVILVLIGLITIHYTETEK